MFPHHSLLGVPDGSPRPVPRYDNPNQHLSTLGMIITLGINIGVFVVLVAVFEIHRFYKQIYLKRLQKRFEVLYATISLCCCIDSSSDIVNSGGKQQISAFVVANQRGQIEIHQKRKNMTERLDLR